MHIAGLSETRFTFIFGHRLDLGNTDSNLDEG